MSEPKTDARSFFDAIASRYDRAYALRGEASRRRVSLALDAIREKTRVLVLGVGTGRELSALLDAGHMPIGLDFSSEMLAKCTHRARPVKLVSHDFWTPLPFDPESFDAVLALHGTIAHPPEDREGAISDLAKEVARVLSSGGVFYAEVPAPSLIGALAQSPIVSEEGHTLRREGERGFVHEDTVRAIAIRGVAVDPETWSAWLRPSFDEVTIAPLDSHELSITAKRAEKRARGDIVR